MSDVVALSGWAWLFFGVSVVASGGRSCFWVGVVAFSWWKWHFLGWNGCFFGSAWFFWVGQLLFRDGASFFGLAHCFLGGHNCLALFKGLCSKSLKIEWQPNINKMWLLKLMAAHGLQVGKGPIKCWKVMFAISLLLQPLLCLPLLLTLHY